MRNTRLPLGKILDYMPAPVSQSTIRRAYNRWRDEQKLPLRCDNSTCHLSTPSPQWNGKALPLILDHVDGNRKNNRPSNLRFLCPNCDAQLPTRGGGNKGRIRQLTVDSYHVVERDGSHEVKVMITGVSAYATAGRVGAEVGEP